MITSWVQMSWAIRISGYPLLKFSDFLRILGPSGLNFKAIMLKLGVNDHLMGADISGNSDIRIFSLEFFGFFLLFLYFTKSKRTQ